MVVVFLDYLFRAGVELDDLFVAHACNELVVEGRVGVEPDDMRNLASCEAMKAFSGLCIPELHVAVVGSCQELIAGIIEGNIGDSL